MKEHEKRIKELEEKVGRLEEALLHHLNWNGPFVFGDPSRWSGRLNANGQCDRHEAEVREILTS